MQALLLGLHQHGLVGRSFTLSTASRALRTTINAAGNGVKSASGQNAAQVMCLVASSFLQVLVKLREGTCLVHTCGAMLRLRLSCLHTRFLQAFHHGSSLHSTIQSGTGSGAWYQEVHAEPHCLKRYSSAPDTVESICSWLIGMNAHM